MDRYTFFGSTFITAPDTAINLTEVYGSEIVDNIVEKEFSYDLMELEDLVFESLDRGSIFKASGDSMKSSGILDGDIVIADKSIKADYGDTVVAFIEGRYVIRILHKDAKGKICLKASSPKHKLLYGNDLKVFGVVMSVIRKLRK